ncbi:MAG: ABC transporter ATP-binding protein [Candidatus Nanopelagicales bacterium]
MQRFGIPHPYGHLPLEDPGTPRLESFPKFLLGLALGMKRLLISGIFFGIVGLGAMAAMPGFIGEAVQSVSDNDWSGVQFWALMILLLGAFTSWTTIMRHRRAAAMWATVANRLQLLISVKASKLGADLPKYVSTGEVVSVNSNDVERVARGFDLMPRFVGAVLSFFTVSYILITGSTRLGLLIVIGVPILVLGVAFLIKPLEKREDAQRDKLRAASDLAADTVAGLRVLRGIGGEDVFVDRFAKASQEVRVAAVKTARMRAVLHGLEVFLPGILFLGVVFFGGTSVANGELKIGTLVSFAGYSIWMILPIQTMIEFSQRWASASVSGRRVLKLLQVEGVNEWGNAELGDVLHIKDELSGVEVNQGEFLVVVADSTQSGDEISERLGGYKDLQTTRVNGRTMSSYAKHTVRELILVQEKEPTILSGTVSSHFDVPTSHRIQIDDALHAASAHDVIDALEGNGLESEIIERGRTMSGGQRQRLALARSLYVDAEVLILDEPTSAVDAHSESRIAERIRVTREGKTTVIFSSSPLMLDKANRVTVVIDGKAVVSGKHSELLQTNALYRDLVVRGE